MQNNLENNNPEQIRGGIGSTLRQLDKGQKIAVAVLAFFAILVVVIWVIQTKRGLRNPLEYQAKSTNQSSACIGGNCGGDSEAVLRAKDTDRDGLSDYDELNIYNTSPYLEDSDSDGYSDKQEINSQNDPNCPFGQECYIEPVLPAEQEENSLLLTKPQQSSNIPVDTIKQIGSAEQVLNGKSDAQTLRAVLLESGMDSQALGQISDDELMNSYQDILAN